MIYSILLYSKIYNIDINIIIRDKLIVNLVKFYSIIVEVIKEIY